MHNKIIEKINNCGVLKKNETFFLIFITDFHVQLRNNQSAPNCGIVRFSISLRTSAAKR